MKNRRLNIPATLIHTMKGQQYKVNGLILSINESNDTCTMKFDDFTSSNIPMNKVLINEGFIDKIKEYGKKIASYITRKVKGFIVLVDEAAQKVFPWSLYNAGNLAIEAANGQMPAGVYFAPTKTLQQTAGVKGMSIDEAFAHSIQNDRNEIVKYWKRVISRAGTTEDESIEESVKYVNEHYYKTSNVYKKALNEAIYDYGNTKDKNGQSQYGTEVSSKQLKAKLKQNIRKQISGPLGGHAKVKPYLIWGAPGIGKTAICKQVLKELATAKYNAVNLNLQTISLRGMTIEQWTLPKDNTRTIDGVLLRNFGDTPKSWLPVYLKDADPEVNKKRDAFFNTCKHLANNENGEILAANNQEYEGGVVFFDEYSRIEPNVQNILMGLSGDYVFGDNYNVASKWGFVYASNRAIDENEADSENPVYTPTAAQADRFIHITYVPDKAEWLEWAREQDPITHEANVPPFICDFIEASEDYVWYSTIVNGGYDNMLNNPQVDRRAHEADDPYSEIQQVLDQTSIKGTKYQMTPRKWADQVAQQYRLELQDILGRNDEGISGEEAYKELVKQSKFEKVDEEGKTYKEYYGGILPNVLIDALNNIDEEAWESWVEDQGGEEELDPAGSYRGIKKRYNLFMSWFLNDLRETMNDSTGNNWQTATSPIMQSWKDYQSFAKHFTPETINSIWETGSMPKEYQSDDDRKPLTNDQFADTQYSKWKSTTNMVLNVMDTILEDYPGNIESDEQDDIENMKSADVLSDNDVVAEANKLIDEFAFKINGKKVNLLFDAKELADVKSLRNRVNCLRNSVVCQRLTHFASWAAKITIQTNIGNVAESLGQKIYDKARDVDSDVFNDFNNTNDIRQASVKLAKDKKDVSAKADKMFEESKSPMNIPLQILKRAVSYDFEKTLSKRKK